MRNKLSAARASRVSASLVEKQSPPSSYKLEKDSKFEVLMLLGALLFVAGVFAVFYLIPASWFWFGNAYFSAAMNLVCMVFLLVLRTPA